MSPTTTQGPSHSVLSDVPARALQLLSTLSRSIPIRAALAQRGYEDADHQEGWALLLKVSGYREPVATSSTLSADVRDAVATLDAWDEPNFRILRATLERRHPEQAAFVMEGLAPAEGAAAVLGVATLLDRLDALESGKGRKATHKEDLAALATLAKRGITKEERMRLRALVETASRADMPEAAETLAAQAEPAASAKADKAKAAQAEAKNALYGWYREWSETARSVITRRDYLIRMGLSKRKSGKAAKSAGDNKVA